MVITMERAIAIAARNVMFEFNDEFTRAEFVNIVEPFHGNYHGKSNCNCCKKRYV